MLLALENGRYSQVVFRQRWGRVLNELAGFSVKIISLISYKWPCNNADIRAKHGLLKYIIRNQDSCLLYLRSKQINE